MTVYAASLRVKLNSLVAAAALALAGLLAPPEAIAQVGGANVGGQGDSMNLLKIQVFSIFIVLTLDGPANAQETVISGRVTDAIDAVVPGVTVTAVHAASGNSFVAVSDATGIYRISAMRPGTYTIMFEFAGFRTVTRDNVELLVGQTLSFNVKMTLESVAQSLTVSSTAPLIDVTQSKLGGNIDTRQVEALPVNGRNWMALTMLAPGSRANDVSESVTGTGGATGDKAGSGGLAQRGDPGYFQLIVDGQQVTNSFAQAIYGQPKYALDAVAEFQFLSSRFDATYGRSVGFIVNAVTRSGTNTVSGSVYGYFRDDRFIAKDFVAKRVLPYSSQQAGVTIGGPIIEDKMHVFGYYEGEHEPQTFIFNSAYPKFNIPSISVARAEHKAGVRFDYQLSRKMRLLIRTNGWKNHLPIDPVRFDSVVQHPSRSVEDHRYANGQLFVALTQTLGEKTVNEVRVGFFLSDSNETPWPVLEKAPLILLRGYTIGTFSALPLRLTGRTTSFRDDYTKVLSGHGRHELKLGADVLLNSNRLIWTTTANGVLQANGGPVPTNIEDLFPVWNDPTTWNLQPLSPITVRWQQSFPTCSTVTHGCGYSWLDTPKDMAAWIQDNWAINSNLTLNLGLRWDLQYNWAGQQFALLPLHRKFPNDWDNVAPRLGVAYTLADQKTVLRGGWGKYFIGAKDQWTHFIPANFQLAVVGILNDGRPDFASNPFNGPPPTYETAQTLLHDTVGNVIVTDAQLPYSYQTSAGLQRQLSPTLSVQADYVWIAGRNEQSSVNSNLSFDRTTGVNYPFTDPARRPWPYLGITGQYRTDGQSNYHALEVALTKRFNQHWEGSATYTLSKFRDYQAPPLSGNDYVTFPVPSDLGDNWAYAMGDQRHRVALNCIVKLPNSFQVSGLYLYGSGQQFSSNYGADLRDSGNSFNRLRPDGTIVPRDGVYGTPFHRVDLRLLRGVRIAGRTKLEGSLEVFNIFNHTNYGNYVISEASPLFRQPVQNPNVAYLPRMLQLGFRVAF